MTTIGTFEAKTHFAALIDKAVMGQETLITRRGKLVAKIVPINTGHDVENAALVVKRLRAFANKVKLNLSQDEIKAFKEEGRK